MITYPSGRIPVLNLFWLFIVALGSFGIGARAIKLLRLSIGSNTERLVFSISIGLGVLSYATLALGLLGLLYKGIFYLLVTATILVGGKEILDAVQSIIKWVVNRGRLVGLLELRAVPCLRKLGERVLGGVFVAHVLLNTVAALAPPVYADSLGYHLAAVKVYIQVHRVSFIPLWTWNFPFTPQMLYMLGILLWSDRVATLTSVLMGTLTALGIFAFGRKHLRLTRLGALMGSLLFYTTPLVINVTTTPQEDAGLALFTFLALYALVNWLDTDHKGWLAISALMAGWAVGSKYTVLLLPPCLAVFALAWSRRKYNWLKSLRTVAFLCLVAAAVASPWYLKNWIATGNPLWPHFYSLLGGRYWTAENAAGYSGQMDLGGPLFEELKAFVVGPWVYTVQQFPKSRILLSPAFLAFLPGLPLVWQQRRLVKDIVVLFLAYALVFYSGWFITNRNVSYFSSVIPALALLTAYVIERLSSRRRWWRVLSGLVVGLNLIFCLGGALAYASQAVPVVFGLESEEEFLLENAPYYEVWQYVNHHLPPESKLFIFPRHGYYLDREYFRASSYMQTIVNYAELDSADELLARLRELGFTHIVWDEGYGRGSDQNLARAIGEETRVEGQLKTLRAEGYLDVVYEGEVRLLRSRLLGEGEVCYVVIYEISEANSSR
jgi:hypothetical protein